MSCIVYAISKKVQQILRHISVCKRMLFQGREQYYKNQQCIDLLFKVPYKYVQ